MSTQKYFLLLIFLSSVLTKSAISHTTYYEDPEEQVIRRVIKECTQSKSRLSCFTNKATTALERSMDWNIPLFDGIELVRNDEKVKDLSQARSLSGFSRFVHVISKFLDTHTLSLDLTKNGNKNEARGGGDDDKNDKKELKKEKKYMQYAFMVLLGIFGLTGPLVMKTLAVIAAKALIASKVALIIVGSVALKKIFEKDHGERPSVKVHTIQSEDEHDRIYNPAVYWGYEPYTKPTL